MNKVHVPVHMFKIVLNFVAEGMDDLIIWILF